MAVSPFLQNKGDINFTNNKDKPYVSIVDLYAVWTWGFRFTFRPPCKR